jgi:hypothetical protein
MAESIGYGLRPATAVLERTSVVAFVQDEETREILQTAIVEVR